MKEIKLSQGKVAIVDDDDYERLSRFKWYAQKRDGRGFRAIRSHSMDGGYAMMHRVVMNARRGEHVDHINHDGLDNRKSNLRKCTIAQNNYNRRKGHGSMLFKGIKLGHGCRNSYEAAIRFKGEHIYLGSFPSQERAAMEYDKAAMFYYGEFANTNFPKWMYVYAG